MTFNLEKSKIISWPLDLRLGKVKRHFGGKMSFFRFIKECIG
jgi:hypothetical protein